MLTFFRRIIYTRFGVVITLGVLGVIALAFAAGDITGMQGSNQSSILGGEVAQVGKVKLGEAELKSRTATALDAYRQQQPTLDMATFVNGGGLDAVLDRSINSVALQQFAERIGMTVSRKAVEGEIASIPAFHGLDGKFSQAAYDMILRQQRITDKQVREDIARDTLARQLTAPTLGAAQVPAQVALPYASLLLEKRQGTIGYIPLSAIDFGAPPSDADLNSYYTRNRGRYTVGERRSARYAIVHAAEVTANAKPTEADIAAAYKSQAPRFAATEKRGITQVIVLDQAGANAIAEKVKAGTPIATAARAAGLEPSSFTGLQKAEMASQAGRVVADAVFAAADGAVIGPVRSQLGWHVAKVDKVETVAARTLDQVRAELTTELTKVKSEEALAKLHDSMDDSISQSATFDEIVSDAKLKAETTPALLTGALNPDLAPNQTPDPVIVQLIAGAFTTEPGDAPQLVQIGTDGSFAVVATGQVVPAAPRPLAQIKAEVQRDFAVDRALKTARDYAVAAVAKAGKGVPLTQALAETKLKLPPVEPVNFSRAQLAAAREQLPPPVALMFSMRAKTAKLLEAPGRAGWFVVYLDRIEEGDAKGNAGLIAQTRQGLGSVSGRELTEQFTIAVRNNVGVKRNESAIAKVRNDMNGTAAGNQ
jgi:peptidyl-prolyl cis-trans isomerase D